MNLLLIDDDKDFKYILSSILRLKKPHITIFDASHGLEAINIIKEIKIDFVLLDLQMPLMSGIEFLEKCKQENITFPYIIMSGNLENSTRSKQYHQDAIDCIKKPFLISELAERLCTINIPT